MVTWTEDVIRVKLATDPAWRVRGLLAVYARQTSDEQYSRATTEHNSKGFTGVDAEILSSFAEQVKAGRSLSAKQSAILERRIGKYAKQLVKIANGEL